MSKRDWIEVTTSLLGGAGLGAAVMYLFDPDRGQNRRDYLAHQAASVAASAERALGSGWDHVADHARTAGRYVSDQAGHLASNAGDWIGNQRDAASSWGNDAANQARSYGRQIHRRAGEYMGYQQGPTVGGVTSIIAGAVGALALGAGLMFLLDPDQGRRRRAIARNKAAEYTHDAGEFVQHQAQNVADFARNAADQVSGAAHDLKNKVTGAADKATEKVQDKVAEVKESHQPAM